MALLTTPEELVEFLTRVNHGQGTIAAVTEVRMNKRGNPFVGAVKVQLAEVKWGVDYEERVNLFRAIEFKPETFRAEGLKWGECDDNIVITHNNQLYIKTIFLRNIGTPEYYFQGNRIDWSVLERYMPPYYGSPKQNLDNEVKVRSFMLKNIVSLVIGETTVYEKPLEVNG